MALLHFYLRHAGFRWSVRLLFWGLVGGYFTARLGQPLAALAQPPVLAFVLRHTLLAAGFCYATARWFIPRVLPKRYGLLGLAGWLAGWFVLEGLSIVATYQVVLDLFPPTEPLASSWRASYAAYRREGYFTFLLDSSLFAYVFYRHLSYYVVLVLKLLKDALLAVYEEEIHQKRSLELELTRLKSRIHPDFLFHTLGNLEAMAGQPNRDERVAEQVLKLSDMMRYLLYETGAERVPLTKELEFLNHYVELEQSRLSNSVEVRYELLGQHLDARRVPPLLLFPFVERAFRGVRSYLHLSIDVTAQELALCLDADQRPDVPVGQLEEVERRFRLLFPEPEALTLLEEPTRLRVLLVLRESAHVPIFHQSVPQTASV
jgi:hypothetical protein